MLRARLIPGGGEIIRDLDPPYSHSGLNPNVEVVHTLSAAEVMAIHEGLAPGAPVFTVRPTLAGPFIKPIGLAPGTSTDKGLGTHGA